VACVFCVQGDKSGEGESAADIAAVLKAKAKAKKKVRRLKKAITRNLTPHGRPCRSFSGGPTKGPQAPDFAEVTGLSGVRAVWGDAGGE
jgi:hypothetical protein